MATKAKEEPADKPHPTHKARLGPLQLAIWENDYQTEEGELRTFHTITLERSYKDKNDEWHKTSQLRESDLGEAIALLQHSQQFLVKTGN